MFAAIYGAYDFLSWDSTANNDHHKKILTTLFSNVSQDITKLRIAIVLLLLSVKELTRSKIVIRTIVNFIRTGKVSTLEKSVIGGDKVKHSVHLLINAYNELNPEAKSALEGILKVNTRYFTTDHTNLTHRTLLTDSLLVLKNLTQKSAILENNDLPLITSTRDLDFKALPVINEALDFKRWVDNTSNNMLRLTVID